MLNTEPVSAGQIADRKLQKGELHFLVSIELQSARTTTHCAEAVTHLP
jgi:hypothetical protein